MVRRERGLLIDRNGAPDLSPSSDPKSPPALDQIASSESRRNVIGLDALSFFIADVQTGFGPFIAVYLAISGWSEGAIGQALSFGAMTAMVSQLPGGALVDRLGDKRVAAAGACVVVGLAALLFAGSASRLFVFSAEGLHSFGSAMLGPAVAAVSLAVVGRRGLGERLGRNARFAAIGNGVAAAALGAAGSYVSPGAVFWLTGAFMVPGLAALWLIRVPSKQGPGTGATATPAGLAKEVLRDLAALFSDPRVLGFAACIALFHLANAALLPLAGAALVHDLGPRTNMVIAAAVVVPQAIVAIISPWVGRAADRRGTRLILTLGFVAVPLRAALLGWVTTPIPTVAVQALDGIGAAAFGVLVPLVAADLTRGTTRFNLCLGAFGLATAGGATVSTSLAGWIADARGNATAFAVLAVFGIGAVCAAWLSTPRAPAAPGGP